MDNMKIRNMGKSKKWNYAILESQQNEDMLLRKVNDIDICYTGKWTIWTYAIQANSQYEHIMLL